MMEKRAIVAFALSMALLVVYLWVQEHFFAAPPAPKQTTGTVAPAPQGDQTAEPPRSPPAATMPAPVTSPPVPAAPGKPIEEPARPRPSQRTAVVDAPLYHGVVSSEGGKLQEWTLHYRGVKPMVILGDQGPGGLQVAAGDPKAPVALEVGTERIKLEASEAAGDLVLAAEEGGLRIRQTLKFGANDYTIDARIRVENPGSQPRQVTVLLPWSTRQRWGEVVERFHGQHATEIVWSSKGHVDRIEDLTAAGASVQDGDWIGLGSIWYLAAMIPRTPGFQLVTSAETPAADPRDAKAPAGRVTVAVRATPTIAAGGVWEGRVLFYAGPKEHERLRAHGLEDSINFGGFPLPRRWGGLPMEWIGVPILLLMKWLYRYVGNYGVAIILITVVSKVLFYPLTVKSIRSMKAMQALQPQVNALRTKHKSDPQRAQREMMDLYRKYHVNPMGGCLPMVAQVPIFYALYLALSVSVELQSATFLCFGRIFGVDLWICDLASQDPTYVLPVLMGATMFVQQKMTPTTGDPRQAKMMLVMPFVFTFMFLNLPSGLVLYWSVSNVLQILQQWYMERSGHGLPREPKNAAR